MSFSAHADAKGIMQLIRMAEPRNMLLVHGEALKMEFLKGKIEQEFSKSISIHINNVQKSLVEVCMLTVGGECVVSPVNVVFKRQA